MKISTRLLSPGACSLVTGLLLASMSWAHNGEVPQPPPRGAARAVEVQPPRWSWLHWWEANRNLKSTPESMGQAVLREPLAEETRNKLVKSLGSILNGIPIERPAAGGGAGHANGGRGQRDAAKENGGKPEATDSKGVKGDAAQGGGDKGKAAKDDGAKLEDAKDKGGKPEAAKDQADRPRAAPARKTADLRAAARAKNPKLRSAVLLALGRIGGPEALDILANAARTEMNPGVRRDAITALGLLSTPEAKTLLLEDPAIRAKTLTERSAASGLLDALNKDISDELQTTVGLKNVNPASLATWALQNRKDPRAIELFLKILATSPSAWLASDALLYLGRMKDPQAIPLLADLLLATPKARQIAAYRVLDDAQRLIGRRDQAFRSSQSQQKRGGPPAVGAGSPPATPGQQNAPGGSLAPTIVSGMEWTYASELRGSAAMALGMIEHPDARTALINAMNLPDDYYSDLFKGPTLISLGQIGDEQCLKVLIIFLNKPKLKLSQQKAEYSPLPGYAAMGLGLYARPTDGQAPAAPGNNNPPGGDRPDYQSALAALTQHLINLEEKNELRTGCALALGLSERPEAIEPLLNVSKTFRPGDDALIGYTFLARAMLHDRTILEPVRHFLGVVKQKKDMNGILGQRAAILALGLLDTEDAIPILKQAWNINYYASREVIIALSLSRSTSAGDMLLDLLTQSEDPAEQAFVSLCLGEFYAKDPHSPLYRFISDTNYMMKNENLLAYQQLANEFLFNYLIGAFGNEWK